MKVLKGTSAWINGKLYSEGSSIPKEFETEFSIFLVETEIKYPVPDVIKSVPEIVIDLQKNKNKRKK